MIASIEEKGPVSSTEVVMVIGSGGQKVHHTYISSNALSTWLYLIVEASEIKLDVGITIPPIIYLGSTEVHNWMYLDLSIFPIHMCTFL